MTAASTRATPARNSSAVDGAPPPTGPRNTSSGPTGSTLYSSLRAVAPALPPPLVGLEVRDALAALAARLPPVHHAGFECRLAAAAPRVDLHQGFVPTESVLAHLSAYLACDDRRRRPPWSAVARFAARPPAAVRLLVLEFDGAGKRPSAAAPSVFFSLTPAARGGRDPDGLAAVAALFPGVFSARRRQSLLDLQHRLPARARMTDLGLRRSGRRMRLRVVVGPLDARQRRRVLAACGWHARDALESSLAPLHRIVAAAMLALDLDEGIGPQVGVEFYPGDPPSAAPAWEALLAELVRHGWCAPEKAAAILAWPGVTTPCRSGSPPWPDDLIVRSLAGPAERLGVLQRRLSHVKLVCRPDGPIEAKAYFGWRHRWVRGRPPTAGPSPGPRSSG